MALSVPILERAKAQYAQKMSMDEIFLMQANGGLDRPLKIKEMLNIDSTHLFFKLISGSEIFIVILKLQSGLTLSRASELNKGKVNDERRRKN